MTLTRALSTATTGLRANSFRAEVAAGNVANANTPGYVRRQAVTSELVTAGQGNGIRIVGTQRHQDFALTGLRREADASVGRSDVISQTYEQLNLQLGTPDTDYGLFSAHQNLESSLRELSATPESAPLQAAVLSATQDIVDQFNSLSKASNSLRQTADQNIAKDVETVNDALYQLEALNGTIGSLYGSGDTSALEDERQRVIDTISQIVPVQTVQKDNGQIELLTKEGVYLLSNQVNELSFTPANIIPANAEYFEGSNILSGLKVGDTDITPSSGKNFSLSSGSLSGHFAARDTILPNFNSQLDSMAADLINRFSDDSLDPTKTAGAPGIFTDAGSALDPLNSSGIAGRIRVNEAVDPAQGGSITRFRDGLGANTAGPEGNPDLLNGILDALSNANSAPADAGLVGNFSFSELLAGFTSTIGENKVRHDAINSSATVRQNLFSDAEIQSSGVDTDAELQSLLIIEQAYAANARIIQVVGEMFDRLMQI